MNYDGLFKLQSSAYRHLNFASKFKFIQAMGHVEAKVDFNNAPDLIDPEYNLAVRMVFVRHLQLELGRTTASIEVTRPKSKTDIKVMFK